jgi:hypothetical protein
VIRSNLTDLTQAEHQHDIDVMLQCINEVFTELTHYGVLNARLKTGTITLVTSQQSYQLSSSFTGFHVPWIEDLTNDFTIGRYKGSHKEWLVYTIGQDSGTQTGQPLYFFESGTGKVLQDADNVASPGSGLTHNYIDLYPIPDSTYNGNVYTYWYQESIIAGDLSNDEPYYTSATTSTTPLPVTDATAHMLVPAMVELWRMYRTESFNNAIYARSMTLATQVMMPYDRATSY